MSMFHELMMRKKEQIMYATIKGSLTENDGIFSGFSDSNYLEMQQSIPNLDVNSFLEIELKVTMPETITRQQIIGSNNLNYTANSTYDIGFQVFDDNRLLSHCYNSTTDERYTIQITSSSALNGKTCYIKYTIANRRMTISLSFDKISWESNYYTLPTTFSYTKASYSIFGWGRGNSAFSGSIDLNNSYIKLGSTKYKLQAVVGYTVVGSPTIVDGVVSGFSASNYLSFAQQYSGVYPSGRIAFTYERQSSMNQILLVIQSGSLFPFRIRAVDRTPQINWVDAENTQKNMMLSYSLVAGVYYSLSWEVKSGKIFFTLFDSLGNILETKNQDISLEATTSGAAKIGWYSTTSYWQGSIDLNNTYIKDGNKLWFNGQQA